MLLLENACEVVGHVDYEDDGDYEDFYLLATYLNNNTDGMREMLRLLQDPDGIAEVVERNDDHVVIKIRPDVSGL